MQIYGLAFAQSMLTRLAQRQLIGPILAGAWSWLETPQRSDDDDNDDAD